jgi:hypothetical protein
MVGQQEAGVVIPAGLAAVVLAVLVAIAAQMFLVRVALLLVPVFLVRQQLMLAAAAVVEPQYLALQPPMVAVAARGMAKRTMRYPVTTQLLIQVLAAVAALGMAVLAVMAGRVLLSSAIQTHTATLPQPAAP